MIFFGFRIPPQPLVLICLLAGMTIIEVAVTLHDWPLAQFFGAAARLSCYALAAAFLWRSFRGYPPEN
jgi:hypothetical protein